MEEVLEGRTEVTNEDLEKLQYTGQVIKMYPHKYLSCVSTTVASVKPPMKDPSNKDTNCVVNEGQYICSQIKVLDD